MDVVEKYEILSNGISIYTQNFRQEKSLITACGANEATKRADIFSKVRHKYIFHRIYSLARCGSYETINAGDTEFDEIEIPLKIELRRFLPLSNIKYLPTFASKLELKIMFGTKGLVYCTIGSSYSLLYYIADYNQFWDPIKMWVRTTVAGPHKLHAEYRYQRSQT